MKFLADENLYMPIVNILRDNGHNVLSILEEGKTGAPDEDIFQIAVSENRIILTMDKHFTNMLRFPSYQCGGIIVVRLYKIRVDKATRLFFKFFNELLERDIKKNLIIISRKKVRIRRFN
jgi:predicted nuclease of predicted toxin-antitoxin system